MGNIGDKGRTMLKNEAGGVLFLGVSQYEENSGKVGVGSQ